MRILLVGVGFMILLFSSGVLKAKQDATFGQFVAIPAIVMEKSREAAMLLAQSNGDGNRRQGCDRRDNPPLSS